MTSTCTIPNVFVGCKFASPSRGNTERLGAMTASTDSLNSVSLYMDGEQFAALHDSKCETVQNESIPDIFFFDIYHLSENQLIGFVGLFKLNVEQGLCHLLILLDNSKVCFMKTVIEYICQFTQQKHLKLHTLICRAPRDVVGEDGTTLETYPLHDFLEKFSFTPVEEATAETDSEANERSILMHMSITDFLQRPNERREQSRRIWQGSQDARQIRDGKPTSPHSYASRGPKGGPRGASYQLLSNAAADTRGLCRYFLQGNCRFGSSCRYPHIMPSLLPYSSYTPAVAFVPMPTMVPAPNEGGVAYPIVPPGSSGSEVTPNEGTAEALLLDLLNSGGSKWLDYFRYFPDPADTDDGAAAYLTKDMIEAVYRCRNVTPFQSLKELVKVGILQSRGLSWAPLLQLNMELCCNYTMFRNSLRAMQYPYGMQYEPVYYQPYPITDAAAYYDHGTSMGVAYPASEPPLEQLAPTGTPTVLPTTPLPSAESNGARSQYAGAYRRGKGGARTRAAGDA